MILSKSVTIFAAMFSSVLGGNGRRWPVLRTLFESERNFARTSRERGIRQSFLQFLADASAVFAPDPNIRASPGTLRKHGYYLSIWKVEAMAIGDSFSIFGRNCRQKKVLTD